MPLGAPHIYEAPNPDGDIFPATAGTSQRGVWQSNVHKFTVSLSADAAFRDNTSYFPGWTAYVDNQRVPIRYQDDAFGRLLVSVPKGEHVVSFRFGEPRYRMTANIVSVVATIFALFVFVWVTFLSNKRQKGILQKVDARVDPGNHRGSVRKKSKKKFA